MNLPSKYGTHIFCIGRTSRFFTWRVTILPENPDPWMNCVGGKLLTAPGASFCCIQDQPFWKKFQRGNYQKLLRSFYAIAYRDKNFVLPSFMSRSSVQQSSERFVNCLRWKRQNSLRRMVCYIHHTLPYSSGGRRNEVWAIGSLQHIPFWKQNEMFKSIITS